ncbi:MAG: uracil phosphoribosyltransferase [Isosphaeraceae bacterium]|nr:uracil phosphoribosyltransferase [Isosphaeraceae bacterium]
MSLVVASQHPLVHHFVAELRDARTRPAEFRRLVRVLAGLIAVEALADLSLIETEVRTPLGPCPSRRIDERVVIVPILRAGLGMVESILELVPDAEVHHLGLKRDEATLEPTEYYRRLSHAPGDTRFLVVDPMLATGGSAVHACRLLREIGARRIAYLALIAAPEGIERLGREDPEVSIHVAAIDQRLNEVGFIYPGLGDAGDRQFATFDS